MVDGVIGAGIGDDGLGDAPWPNVPLIGHAISQDHHHRQGLGAAVEVEFGLGVEDGVADISAAVGVHAINGALYGVEVGR